MQSARKIAYDKEYRARPEVKGLDLKLAESQQWVCPWCLKDLPTDLRHVHLDHVIPVSLGGPDIEWNLQVLHASCNESKKDRITSRAVELATEHGMIDCFTWTTEN
jgi:5-methylcytosine-specific restriction endonuclease McrA